MTIGGPSGNALTCDDATDEIGVIVDRVRVVLEFYLVGGAPVAPLAIAAARRFLCDLFFLLVPPPMVGSRGF